MDAITLRAVGCYISQRRVAIAQIANLQEEDKSASRIFAALHGRLVRRVVDSMAASTEVRKRYSKDFVKRAAFVSHVVENDQKSSRVNSNFTWKYVEP